MDIKIFIILRRMNKFKFIVAKYFFPGYAPEVRNWKHKMREKNSNGNELHFSEDDIKNINFGMKKLFKDLIK